MTQAKQGDTVKVHYTGRFKDGTVFDSSRGGDPLEFQLGAGHVIPGFDAGVTGMNIGDKREVEIPAEQAYGPYHAELAGEIERDRLPPDITPEVGMVLQMMHPSGMPFNVQVVGVEDDKIKLDANHPMAGKDLIFDLELVEVGGDGGGPKIIIPGR
jgi:peptidylprolyl isomerase